MDEIPKPIQDLDFVLKFLATSPVKKGGFDFDQILKRVKPDIPDADTLVHILDKFKADGYLSEEKGSYSLNKNGDLFYLLNGYEGDYLDMLQEKRNKDQKYRLDRQVACLTKVIAVGTSVAALYYLKELWVYFFVSH